MRFLQRNKRRAINLAPQDTRLKKNLIMAAFDRRKVFSRFFQQPSSLITLPST